MLVESMFGGSFRAGLDDREQARDSLKDYFRPDARAMPVGAGWGGSESSAGRHWVDLNKEQIYRSYE
jgi:hypothetical protein